ncbi:MAG: hypothetical protein ING59_00340 [Burkholderiales bacterium]|nr:hypothetical protein [Burkholderiales bacterium]
MAYGGSGRSQMDNQRRSPSWDGAPLTDFAITTVNVPDRLDMQEVRARESQDLEPSRSRGGGPLGGGFVAGVWLRRLLVAGIFGSLIFFAYTQVSPILDGLAADRIADRLTKSLGQRVTVADSRLEFSRSPRLALKGIDVAGKLQIDDVGLRFNYEEVLRAIRGRSRAWGEVEVGPLNLTHDQAMGLLDALPKVLTALPPSASVLRASSVSFSDYPLLPGRYEVVVRRGESDPLASIQMEMLDIEGEMRVQIMPRGPGEPIEFSLKALRWKAPIGPNAPWTDLVASGQVSPDLLLVDRYVGSSFYGVTQGLLVAARDVEWALTGTAQVININLEQLFRGLRPAAGGAGLDPSRSPFAGSASMNLVISGRGPTLGRAVDFATVTGPLEVRYAQLIGINLGLAAKQGVTSSGGGGLTRFTDLDATVSASRGQVRLTNIRGRAGAMAASGDVVVNDDLSISGALRVDFGMSRVLAPINLRVRGTALQPLFTP